MAEYTAQYNSGWYLLATRAEMWVTEGGGIFQQENHIYLTRHLKTRCGSHKETKFVGYTANEGPVRIQNKCLISICVFPEMKLRGLVISKTEL
jgi:hypothetical protein